MTDLYLAAADAAALDALLAALPAEADVDVIGVWYERTGGTDDAPVMTPVPGLHVNVRLPDGVAADLPDGAVAHNPVTPWRCWA
jgi:hypothetical protein